jgi:hypothetical protein
MIRCAENGGRSVSGCLTLVLIAPTYRKTIATIVGYSLPEDEGGGVPPQVGLADLPASEITVVEQDDEHRDLIKQPVGQRYRVFFGDAIECSTEGLSPWLHQ